LQPAKYTLGTFITTTDNAEASISLSDNGESLVLAATPHVNGNGSVTLALHPTLSNGTVTHEINTLRRVKNGDTVVMVMPPIASQTGGQNPLLFVTPTVK